MATNQTGIAIIIKAWLPVSGPIKEQIASLQMVEDAHTTGDYAGLLKAASVEDIKTEQKTRRVEDAPTTPTDTPAAPDFEYDVGKNHDIDPVEKETGEPLIEPTPRKRKQTADAE